MIFLRSKFTTQWGYIIFGGWGSLGEVVPIVARGLEILVLQFLHTGVTVARGLAKKAAAAEGRGRGRRRDDWTGWEGWEGYDVRGTALLFLSPFFDSLVFSNFLILSSYTFARFPVSLTVYSVRLSVPPSLQLCLLNTHMYLCVTPFAFTRIPRPPGAGGQWGPESKWGPDRSIFASPFLVFRFILFSMLSPRY